MKESKSPENSSILEVVVQPGAKKSCVKGIHGGRVKIAISAPPTDGRANEMLIEFLAKELGISKRNISLISGATSRIKRLRVEGVSREQVSALLLP